ncbi:MAG TPA: HAD-IA family hydrolase [Candidatus Udaeobacter sp.]|nr:HAD-IA family hydrolase [Candidatus Udaeobacter sp.]
MIPDIKAVCFDFGGVIELYEYGKILPKIAELLNVPLADFRAEYFKHNHLTNIGNQNWEEIIIKAVKTFSDNTETESAVRALIHKWSTSKKLNTELLSWFTVLKQQGFKVGILSNNTSKLRQEIEAQGIHNLTDVIVISSEIGFQKPHKEAFLHLFEKLNVLPQETIFIDDASKSLEKAAEIGYHPILFQDNEQLKKDLQNFGILL